MKDDVAILSEISNEFSDNVIQIANHVLMNPSFKLWSGSHKPEYHHYGDGGLARHTREVVELSFEINKYFESPVSREQLFLAALYHDFGKIWDYSRVPTTLSIFQPSNDTEYEASAHKELIHHVTRSVIEFSINSEKVNYEWKDDIIHAILAHHGRKEWGSPVAPKTKLAIILNHADSLSARMCDLRTFK